MVLTRHAIEHVYWVRVLCLFPHGVCLPLCVCYQAIESQDKELTPRMAPFVDGESQPLIQARTSYAHIVAHAHVQADIYSSGRDRFR